MTQTSMPYTIALVRLSSRTGTRPSAAATIRWLGGDHRPGGRATRAVSPEWDRACRSGLAAYAPDGRGTLLTGGGEPAPPWVPRLVDARHRRAVGPGGDRRGRLGSDWRPSAGSRGGRMVFRALRPALPPLLPPDEGAKSRRTDASAGIFGRLIGTGEGLRLLPGPAGMSRHRLDAEDRLRGCFEVGPTLYTPGSKMARAALSSMRRTAGASSSSSPRATE